MRVQIATRRCDVDDQTLERTEELVAKLDKYDPRVTAAEVVFTEEKKDRSVEIILHIDGTAPIVGSGDGPEFRSAVDRAVERVGRMLRKQRSRHRDHQAPKLSEASAE